MDDDPNKRISTLTKSFIGILTGILILGGIFIVKGLDKEIEEITISPSESYVYAVLNPDEIALRTEKDFIGGVQEETKSLIIDLEVPDWEILNPINDSRITHHYWWQHRALDITTDSGNHTIHATANGRVSFVGWVPGYGKRIEINHNNGFVSTYSHLSEYSVGINQVVGSSDELGVMGWTGETTGLHLHFELMYDGVKIDPEPYLITY